MTEYNSGDEVEYEEENDDTSTSNDDNEGDEYVVLEEGDVYIESKY